MTAFAGKAAILLRWMSALTDTGRLEPLKCLDLNGS
jgi:hypothetical protein